MDINTLLVIGFMSFFGYIVYSSLKSPEAPLPQRHGLLVAQDTGKTKHFQSKTGDASLAIEGVRRRAIQGAGRLNKSKIKESKTQTGSATGAIETYMISGICPCIQCSAYDIVYDGGGASNEFCPYDGSGVYALDAGNENTKACGI